MTGTMVERVARAIYASFGEGHPDDWEERDGVRVFAWEAAIPQARAAIEAMRLNERNIPVEQAGGGAIRAAMESDEPRYTVETAICTFNAMIDAALQEENDG